MNCRIQLPRQLMKQGVRGTCKHCGRLCTLSRTELMISHVNPPCPEYTRCAELATSISEAADLNWQPPASGLNAPGGEA